MSKLILIAGLMMLRSAHAATPATTMNDFAFLKGCRASEDLVNVVLYEHWMTPSRNAMFGLAEWITPSMTSEAGTTGEYEFFKIEINAQGVAHFYPHFNGQLVGEYDYDLANSLHNANVQKVIFVNEKVNFPKRVTYSVESASPDWLKIDVVGVNEKGVPNNMTFKIKKVECDQ